MQLDGALAVLAHGEVELGLDGLGRSAGLHGVDPVDAAFGEPASRNQQGEGLLVGLGCAVQDQGFGRRGDLGGVAAAGEQGARKEDGGKAQVGHESA